MSDYRLQHAKRTNKVEIVNFEDHENVGSVFEGNDERRR